MNVSGTIQQKIDLSAPSLNSPVPYACKGESPNLARQYSPGTGAGQLDQLHSKIYTLAASPTTLDLTTLVGTDGSTSNAARVRELYIRNTSAFLLTVGAAAATAWTGAGCPISLATGTFGIPPGGIYLWSDPTTVGTGNGGIVDATHKSLKFDPGANNVTMELIIGSCSAVS